MNTAVVPERPRLSRADRMQYGDAQGRRLLPYPQGMAQPNPGAARILERCSGKRMVTFFVDSGPMAGTGHVAGHPVA